MPTRLFCTAVTAATLLAWAAPAAAQADFGERVYDNTLKATVWIHSQSGGGLATGSGSLIDRRRRLVLTNFHVVGDTDRATVYFPVYRDGRAVPERDFYRRQARGIRGRVVARDRQADLALIQIDEVPPGAQALTLAPRSPAPGQTVHSVGNPGGSGALWLYTPGKVRQVYHKKWRADLGGRAVGFEAQVVETDSATNPGDSGGPLVNDRGELVGVTQGGAVKAQLLSTFIDVTEVQRFLNTQAVRAIPGAAPPASPTAPPEPVKTGFAIKDGGKFFSAEAVEQANQEIKRIAHRFGRDLLIETYAKVPDDDAEKVQAMSREERGNYFRDWAQRRSRAEKVNGMTVIACRNPSILRAVVSPEARSVISDNEARQIGEAALKLFSQRKFDEGLAEIVRLVREAYAEQKP